MHTPIRLEHSTILVERPFTDPQHSREDMARLQGVLEKLRLALTSAPARSDPPGMHIEWQGAGESKCRIVITNAERLRTPTDLSIVGFFGQKRADTEVVAAIEDADVTLIREFVRYPGVLSYCSQHLEAGDWGNLVVLGSSEASEHWGASERHVTVARDLAPRYYRTLRLHNAVLPGGVFSGQAWILQRTKYYDFQEQPLWHAIREF